MPLEILTRLQLVSEYFARLSGHNADLNKLIERVGPIAKEVRSRSVANLQILDT